MAWVPATARTPPPTSHHPPAPTCRCGIYVVREPNTALDRAWITDRSLAHALVQIEAAGRYIEYDDGWRVERARIAAIVDGRITGPDPELHDVSDRYQVPLIEAPFDINFEEPAEPAKPSYHTTTTSGRSYHHTSRATDAASSAINELQRKALLSIAAIKKMIKDVDGDEA